MLHKQLMLDDWQEDVLKHDGHLLLCTGRQVGKTTILAMKAANYLKKHASSQILIISLTEDQAKLIIVMILAHLERTAKSMIARGKHKPTQNRVTLTNNATALARPVGNTGDAMRGFTGEVLIIDEAAKIPQIAFDSAKPVLLTTGGQIWMCSTPHGKTGYFWECFQNKRNRFKVIHTSSVDVIQNRPISPSWSEKQRAEAIQFLDDEKHELSELSFGQEYMGLFLDDLQQFFPDELINKVAILKRPQTVPFHGIFVLGCDLARRGGDFTTMQVLWQHDPQQAVHQVESTKKAGLSTPQNEALIIETAKRWNVKKVGLDAGSGTLGVSIYDHLLQHPDVRRKLVAMNNRRVSMDREGKKTQRLFKEDMYDNLRAMMERGSILLLNDMDVMISLKSIQWEVRKDGSQGVKIFANPHNQSDICEGIIRAAWLIKQKNLNTWMSYF